MSLTRAHDQAKDSRICLAFEMDSEPALINHDSLARQSDLDSELGMYSIYLCYVSTMQSLSLDKFMFYFFYIVRRNQVRNLSVHPSLIPTSQRTSTDSR